MNLKKNENKENSRRRFRLHEILIALINQQKDLAKTMESMAPLVKNAKEMLSGFDFGSLKNMGALKGVMK